MYAALGITAKHFRERIVKQVRNGVDDYDRQVLRGPRSEPPSVTHAPNALLMAATGSSATLNSSIGVGLST
jgi:hypothetical protein